MWFGGLRPTIGELAKRFDSRELPDGTTRDGRSRDTIRHHVGVLVSEGLLHKDGSTVWLTDRGREVAATILSLPKV